MLNKYPIFGLFDFMRKFNRSNKLREQAYYDSYSDFFLHVQPDRLIFECGYPNIRKIDSLEVRNQNANNSDNIHITPIKGNFWCQPGDNQTENLETRSS